MSVSDALQLMPIFGTFIVTLLALVSTMTALHEYSHADDIPSDYSSKKCYKTLLAEKQANMTAIRLMSELSSQTTNTGINKHEY